MRTAPLIFLLLAVTRLPASAQSVVTQPYGGAPSPGVSGPLPSDLGGEFGWAEQRRRVDDSDTRSLQANYYYVLTSFTVKQAFSAELVTERSRLVRGTTQRSQETSMVYVDEAGRRRSSYKSIDGTERILVIDPQRQLGYLIRPNRDDVLRISGTPHNPIAVRTVPGEPRKADFVKQVTTPLGIKEFHGLKASGTLTESYYPPGALGNEKEVVETRETWSLPQLGITVYSRRASPYGETIVQYRDFKLGDPSPSVFEIPPDLKVRDVPAIKAGQPLR